MSTQLNCRLNYPKLTSRLPITDAKFWEETRFEIGFQSLIRTGLAQINNLTTP